VLLFIASPSRALSAPSGGGAYRGVYPHKNILGAAMALGFLVEWYLREHQPWAKILRLLALCAYAALLVASNSVTSMLTVVAAVSAVWTFRTIYRRFQIPAWALGLFLTAGIGAGALMGISPADVMEVLGRSSDLTGRTELWRAVFESIQEKPLLGFGFSGYWKGACASSDNVQGQIGWAPTYSHDGYLEIMLSLGLVGLLLAIWILATLFKRSWRRADEGDSPLDSWPLALFFFVVIHNFTECTIAWQNCLEWSVCLAAVIGCDPRWRPVLADDDEQADETPAEGATPEPECATTGNGQGFAHISPA
jgi:exopolysaccharide production protein ExoQ